MLNKVSDFIRQQNLLLPGEHVTCAVSGGADSVALLWTLYLLRDKLGITLSAAHFNHGLRGEEACRDQAFVEQLCRQYDIPLCVGKGRVTAGKKGLEAAARDARYAFLMTQPGKIATAHTADDNAETLLMHLVRGTDLKGLGGIAPIRGRIIRPMLSVTRRQVLALLEEYHLSWVEDSTNGSDGFLRNRLRHRVMPLLYQENPRFGENISNMALRLRQEEALLESLQETQLPPVSQLRAMPQSLRRRYLRSFLESSGIREPEAQHIALAEGLVFSQKPSAQADFPGGITLCRSYDRLAQISEMKAAQPRPVSCPDRIDLPELGLQLTCREATAPFLQTDRFTVRTCGSVVVRSRQPGDTMRLHGGTKSLKALFIDRKIPARQREQIPVLADDKGVLGVWGIGANLDRVATELPMTEFSFTSL